MTNQKDHQQDKVAEAEVDDSQQIVEEVVDETEAERPLESEQVLISNEELTALRAQSDEYLDGWQRARADFSNYKKRVERDQALLNKNVKGGIIKRYLEITDDLARALENRPQEGDGATWADGIELIYRKLMTILENEGVVPMETDGQLFDPNLHEAISLEDSPDHESGEIIEVLKQGFLLGDRVLRPATVRVAN
jgi:molecular chaperone GrpE